MHLGRGHYLAQVAVAAAGPACHLHPPRNPKPCPAWEWKAGTKQS